MIRVQRIYPLVRSLLQGGRRWGFVILIFRGRDQRFDFPVQVVNDDVLALADGNVKVTTSRRRK